MKRKLEAIGIIEFRNEETIIPHVERVMVVNLYGNSKACPLALIHQYHTKHCDQSSYESTSEYKYVELSAFKVKKGFY